MRFTRASLVQHRALSSLVILAVTLAAAVPAGTLLAGSSIRASLRALALERLGATDVAVTATTSLNARLGAAMVIAAPDTVRQTVSLIAVEGTAAHGGAGHRVQIQIYGVDDAFWTFHGVPAVALAGSEAAISEGLAAELSASGGDTLVLRAARTPDIPLGSLQGRRTGRATRVSVTVVRTLSAERMGDFSLVARQGPVRAVFVPRALLQRELEMAGRVNTVLVALQPREGSPDPDRVPLEAVQRAWLASAALPDHGVRIRRVPGDRVMALEGLGGFISPDLVRRVQNALERVRRPGVPALTYMVDTIRIGDRAIPYSTVTAIDVDGYNRLSVPAGPPAPGTDEMSDGGPLVRGALEVRVGRGGVRVGRVQVSEEPPGPRARTARRTARAPEVTEAPRDGAIWLNEWAAQDLDARVGDTVRLDYLVWTDEHGLEARHATFALQGILPMMRIGGDRTLTPDSPGITNAPDLAAWDSPFPVDRSRIRPTDEAYWDQWQAAPKAFVPLETGQRLWGSPFGNVSSIRFALADADAVAAAIRVETSQISVRAVRAEALAGAEGAADLRECLLYAGAIPFGAALVMTCLFFGLGVERRSREWSVLALVGYTSGEVRLLLLREGLLLTLIGGGLGILGGAALASFLLYGLRTWGVDAVGITALHLTIDPVPLAIGVSVGALAAAAAMWIATRSAAFPSARSLLIGPLSRESNRAAWSGLRPGVALLGVAVAMLSAAGTGLLDVMTGFAGAGAACLLGALLVVRARLYGHWRADGRRPAGVFELGLGHVAWHPARTMSTLTLIAVATFVLIGTLALRREVPRGSSSRADGTGGFALMAESTAPLMYDPNTIGGQAALGLGGDDNAWRDLHVTPLRLRPGDEASRRTLSRPRNPRIVGVAPAAMIGRFAFDQRGAAAPGQPSWTLLDQTFEDGAIPAVVDQATLSEVLHLGVGDTYDFAPDGVTPVTFRIVATLADSILQSELVISERAFVELFPRDEGYRLWLIEAPGSRTAEVSSWLEDRLGDSGVEIVSTAERLDSYHRVGNARLAIFQAFAAIGLMVGMVGLGAVIARNLRERRHEWSLLRAVGYDRRHLSLMIAAETAVIVIGGMAIGAGSASVAIAPTLAAGAQTLSLARLGGMLGAAAGLGVLVSLAALALTHRVPFVGALKGE